MNGSLDELLDKALQEPSFGEVCVILITVAYLKNWKVHKV